MLLSPLASPSRFTPKSLGLPLPPLQHDRLTCDCEHIDEEEDVFSLSSDDDGSDFDRDLDHEECASSNTSDDDDDLEPGLGPERASGENVDSSSIATPAPVDEYVSPPGELVDVPSSRHEVGVEAEPPLLPTLSPPPPSKSLISLTRPAPASPCASEPQLNIILEDQTHTELSSHSNPETLDPAAALVLPVELIFTIVELAAGSHRRSALSLCRVSSWVRGAVLPILYGTLVLQQGRDRVVPFDAVEYYSRAHSGGGNDNGTNCAEGRRRLENPLAHVRSLWLDLPPDRAPYSLDACPRLVQLALPLEAHATICNTQRWFACDPRAKERAHFTRTQAQVQSASLPEVGFRGVGVGVTMSESSTLYASSFSSLPTWRSISGAMSIPRSLPMPMPMPMPMRTQSTSNALHIENVSFSSSFSFSSDDTSPLTTDNTYEDDSEDTTTTTTTPIIPCPCHSFTVLGQSHPHRWAPLTSSPNGRAFLRGVTHLRILNLCLSHYIPLEYTPNLTHLCIPFFDLRLSPSTLSSHSPTTTLGTLSTLGGGEYPTSPLPSFSSLTGSAATSSFTGLDYILSSPSLQMVVLTLNPRYWRFDELSLKGWALRAMARDTRLYVVAETRDDATRDWEVPRRDWEEEARGWGRVGSKAVEGGGMSVWEKAVLVRRKFLTRLSRNWSESAASRYHQQHV